MTDRPRTWTLPLPPEEGNEIVEIRGLRGGVRASVRVVEWDRARVVPIIEQAIAGRRADGIAGRIGCTCSPCMAEAVFDALNGGDDD